jgi:sigma-B regulation protein RsbU (phosphoserine phosphatase)
VVERFEYPTDRRMLKPGDWVFVMTDGATEAMNPSREFFGIERLRTSLSWVPEAAMPSEVIKRLRDDVGRFAAGAELADDITLVAVRWEGGAAGTPPLADADLDAAVARL